MRSPLLAFLLLFAGPLPCVELSESAEQDVVVETVRRPSRPVFRTAVARPDRTVDVCPRPASPLLPLPAPPDDLRRAPPLASRPPPAA